MSFVMDLVNFPKWLASSRDSPNAIQSFKNPLSDMTTRFVMSGVMNPALGMAFAREGRSEVEIPVCIVVAEGDIVVPPGTNGYRFAELIPSAELTVLKGPIGHYVFLCEATEAGKRLDPNVCVDDPSVDRRKLHEDVATLARKFFGRHLNGRAASTSN